MITEITDPSMIAKARKLAEEIKDIEWPQREVFMRTLMGELSRELCTRCWFAEVPCNCENDE
jgi:hypothetical protein